MLALQTFIIAVISSIKLVHSQTYTCGDSVSGKINELEFKYYNFNLPSDGYRVELSTCHANTEFDTTLKFLNADNTQIASCDDCGSCGNYAVMTLDYVMSGDYIIGVGGFDYEEGDFVLEITCTEVTKSPTKWPSKSPTPEFSRSPVPDPTADPTSDPILAPTSDPTKDPTKEPTNPPTKEPTGAPTVLCDCVTTTITSTRTKNKKVCTSFGLWRQCHTYTLYCSTYQATDNCGQGLHRLWFDVTYAETECNFDWTNIVGDYDVSGTNIEIKTNSDRGIRIHNLEGGGSFELCYLDQYPTLATGTMWFKNDLGERPECSKANIVPDLCSTR